MTSHWDPESASYLPSDAPGAPVAPAEPVAAAYPAATPAPQPVWDPVTATYRWPESVQPQAAWDPQGVASHTAQVPVVPAGPTDQWVYSEPTAAPYPHNGTQAYYQGGQSGLPNGGFPNGGPPNGSAPTPPTSLAPESSPPFAGAPPHLSPPPAVPPPTAQANGQPVGPGAPWPSNVHPYQPVQTAQVPVTPPPRTPPPPAAEQWVYVDPSTYSNPYTEAPVYTSGPQPAPSDAPAAAPYQVAWAPGAPSAATGMTNDPLQGFGSPQSLPPTANAIQPGPPQADALLSSAYQPEKGELNIKERRTWKSWQLVSAVILAAVIGMAINGNLGSATGTSAASGGGGYKLPPPNSSTASTTGGSATKSATGAGTATTTTTAAGATSSTVAGSSSTTLPANGATQSTASTTPAAVGPATILVPEVQQTGNWTSPAFTISGGTWNIGWAFQCVPPPSATPTFQIFVVTSGGSPAGSPAVTSSAASGNAVTPLTSAGAQQVVVETTAACRWAVKVTGSGS